MSRDGVVSKFTHGFETKRDRCRVHGSGEGVSLSTGTGLTQFVLTLAVITAIREVRKEVFWTRVRGLGRSDNISVRPIVQM